MGEAEDRDAARRIAARVEIRDVRILKSDFELEQIPRDSDPLSYGLEVRDSGVDWQPGQDLFTIRSTYEVSIAQPMIVDSGDEEPSEETVTIASISFTLAALFRLALREDDAPATDDELASYAATTGAFALYPFAREYVYDVSGRLRLPALTLPVRLVQLTEDEAIDEFP